MDQAVELVEAYLHVNGYLTVTQYPVMEAQRYGGYRTMTDLDILAFRFPGAGRLAAKEQAHAFAPDPALGCPPDQLDVLVGEVKEGRAELNPPVRDPAVLEIVLTRFGCCSPAHAPEIVQTLLQKGCAETHCGHQVRFVVFGSLAGSSARVPYHVVSLGHVQDFLRSYIHEHWDFVRQAQFKDPVFAFLVLMEKAQRGNAAKPGRERNC